MNQLDLMPATVLRCLECGESLTGSRTKFCSIKCGSKHYNRKQDEKLRAASNNLQFFFGSDQYVEPKNPRDRQVCEDYKRKIGMGTLARVYNVDKNYVRKILIRARLYKPDPKHNGIAKKGTGPHSRLVLKQAVIKRMSDARKNAAAILRLMRKGSRVDEAGKQLALRTVPWGILRASKGYRAMIAKRAFRYKKDPHPAWSLKFPKEIPFQDLVEQQLKACAIEYKREYQLPMSRTKADFWLSTGDWIECKVDMRSKYCYTSIGQAMHYLSQGAKRVCVLVPDDVCVRQDLAALINKVAHLVQLSKLAQWLGYNTEPPAISPTSHTISSINFIGSSSDPGPIGDHGRRVA